MADLPLFTYHLATPSLFTTLRAAARYPRPERVPGLVHAECMWTMALGAPIVSPQRTQLRHLAVFARWDDHDAVDRFHHDDPLGEALLDGWNLRLAYLRRWGHVDAFDGLVDEMGETDPDEPVVAVTLARMKLPQVPRFIKWGRPVERLVRDHPGSAVALAAMRLPRTVSTFSIWPHARDMADMVQGHGALPEPERHKAAMAERDRKDFHFEFTTLRFRPICDYRDGQLPDRATGERQLSPVFGPA